jgi:hypothetical protein
VVIESRGADGIWRLLHGRTMIEFRARAARPRASIRREFSVPVEGPDEVLRIGVRGIGRVCVANVELTDGATAMRPLGWPAARQRVIGLPAPKDGFPCPDWESNSGDLALNFRTNGGSPSRGAPS